MRYRFYFFLYHLYEKSCIVSKFIIICVFKFNIFFWSSDNEKVKTILHRKSSPFYVDNISFHSYNCSILGLFIFAMLYICKTERHSGCNVLLRSSCSVVDATKKKIKNRYFKFTPYVYFIIFYTSNNFQNVLTRFEMLTDIFNFQFF